MAGLGHECVFGTPLRHVWQAIVNQHSLPNVGYVAVGGRETHGR